MATCDKTTLLSQACANGFLQLAQSDAQMSRAVVLQLLKNISGESTSTAELLAEACANKFLQLAQSGAQLLRSIHVQLLCNIAGGVAALCINLLPGDATYFEGIYQLNGLIPGQSYQVTFGDDDRFASDGATEYQKATSNPVTFVLVGNNVIFHSAFGHASDPVTATICAV